MNDNVVKKKNFFDRTLNRIETVGNKLPDPVTIFLGLCVLLLILSSLVGSMGISVVHPGTGENYNRCKFIDCRTASNSFRKHSQQFPRVCSFGSSSSNYDRCWCM